MRNELIAEMKAVFGEDQRRIDHALAVLDYAERIQRVEGGDAQVITAAAILHDIGIHEAERKYGSSAGKYQEIEGPAIAEGILGRYIANEVTLKHIIAIIANHHSARDIDTREFRVIRDADRLVNIASDYADAGREKVKAIIDKVLKTRKGRQMAVDVFLGAESKVQ